MTITLRLAMASGCVALLTGCNSLEPFQRADTWHATGVNQSNLAAMIVDPADLVQGHNADATDGALAAAAVDRLRHDRVKPLTDGNSLSSSTPSSAAGLSAN